MLDCPEAFWVDGVKEQNFGFFWPKYRLNIGYRWAPKRNCQPIVDWPKNRKKIGKITKISEISNISEIPEISTKFRDFISRAHMLKFLKKYR